ncbi:MAG: flagellar basal body-associated FliL family protein [Hyphomicrobiales bacterium]|nr:flagellar basal body-associated FliL family protein [Hyphomicrobiales bacterium]
MSEENVGETSETALEAGGAEDPVDEATTKASPIAVLLDKVRRFRIPIAVGGGGVTLLTIGALFFGGADHQEVVLELDGPLSYYELPEFLADLTPSSQRRHHIQILIVAQGVDEDLSKIEEHELEVTAAIQSHLRDQTSESLTGQAGAQRLRGDLIGIINEVIAPARVRNVLFTRILIN